MSRTLSKFSLPFDHGRSNALLRVTISLVHVTLNAGYFSPGTCIATSWTVFSTLLLLWPQPHFKRTGKTLPTLRKKLHARQAVENREEEGCVYSIPLSDLIGKLLELNTSDQRERIDIIDCPCSGRMKTFSFKTFVHE